MEKIYQVFMGRFNKDFVLKKGMNKDEINELISKWITLEDDIYLGTSYKHNWRCKCGNIIEGKRWNHISRNGHMSCGCVLYNEIEQRYKREVEETGEYEYIRSFRKGYVLQNGKTIKDSPSIQIKHKYCGKNYIIEASEFINSQRRCTECCGLYENSFAYHIEVELGESLDKYWDFEKNTVNPYHISKGSNNKVWIKCQEKDYHESYDVNTNVFRKGHRCSYCYGRKVHPKDSFAQYHIDNTDTNFLEKYWDYEKNTVSPFEISVSSGSKVWIKCQDKDYHESYETTCSSFTLGRRCYYCASKRVHPKDSFAQYHIDNTDPNFLEKYWDYEKNTVNPWEISKNNSRKVWIKCQNEEVNELNGLIKKDYHPSYEISCSSFTKGNRCNYCVARKVHPYDSFGYHNFDKVQSWHPDNEISPFRVARNSGKKYKFICDECNHEWDTYVYLANSKTWCPNCSMSKGEKKIKSWLAYNNIYYIHDKPYFDDLLGIGMGVLRPDFILPEHKIWIEYDGEFHFKDMTGTLHVNKEHDNRKNEYAKKHGWKLIRIPYWEFDNIENILEESVMT